MANKVVRRKLEAGPDIVWVVRGQNGAVHLWRKKLSQGAAQRFGVSDIGGVELHHPIEEPDWLTGPVEDPCWLIGCKCRHEGSTELYDEYFRGVTDDALIFEALTKIQAEMTAISEVEW